MGVSNHNLPPRRRVFYGWWVLLAAALGAFCVDAFAYAFGLPAPPR